MTRNEVMNVFQDLARSQGLYARLVRDIYEDEANGEDLSGFWARFSRCHDAVDVVMEVEE